MKVKEMLIWALRRGQVKAMIRRMAEERSQLEKFNAVWADAIENVPFYAEWAEKHRLPREISDLKELNDWPILEKKDLILNREKLTRKGIAKFHESVTGGATGEPLHFRTMAGESDEVALNKWTGWARIGVYPDSRCFLLWGHRHFYGQGLASNVRFKIRQFKDWMTNNLRADATDLSPAALRKDYAMMVKFNPECIIAYSASLLALVRTMRGEGRRKCLNERMGECLNEGIGECLNERMGECLNEGMGECLNERMGECLNVGIGECLNGKEKKVGRESRSTADGSSNSNIQTLKHSNIQPFPRLRGIICTAGPLTKEERGEIEAFFDVPVSMEYGSMEAGVMAYQTPLTRGRYRVFDETHLIHAVPEKVTGNSQVLVTKLYPSYLPLIRYRVGDYIQGEDVDERGLVREFDEVYGRTGDEVDMGNGVRFHGQSFMTCAEGFDQIIAYQIRINRKLGTVTFVAQTITFLSDEEKAEIIKRAAHMSGLLPSSIKVEEAKELVKAPSGKIRLVVVEEEDEG